MSGICQTSAAPMGPTKNLTASEKAKIETLKKEIEAISAEKVAWDKKFQNPKANFEEYMRQSNAFDSKISDKYEEIAKIEGNFTTLIP